MIWQAITGLPRWAWGVILVAVGFIALLIYVEIERKDAVRDAEIAREAQAAKDRDRAADERVNDAIRNTEQQEAYREVIEQNPGGEISPAARALACERLRRVGRIPPACRHSGGDGTEAGSD